jgi:nitrate/nitrite transporter NarK
MFGLLNVVTRPFGGIVADILYKTFPNVWVKKFWIHTVGIIAGAFMIAIGALNPKDESTMFGLIAGFAFFLEAGNGANFALVPHVQPQANGIVSGFTGASGNFGGKLFFNAVAKMNRDADEQCRYYVCDCLQIHEDRLCEVVPDHWCDRYGYQFSGDAFETCVKEANRRTMKIAA